MTGSENRSYSKGEKNPVDNVSWYDVIYFCNKLSLAAGLDSVYAVDGNTDIAEWEYAAKGGQNFTYAGGNNLDKVTWHFSNTDYLTVHKPVTKLQTNGYGLYDMTGNVAEWCWDVDSNGNRTYPGGGGGMYAYSDFCKVTSSESDPASTTRFQIGIRLVRQ